MALGARSGRITAGPRPGLCADPGEAGLARLGNGFCDVVVRRRFEADQRDRLLGMRAVHH